MSKKEGVIEPHSYFDSVFSETIYLQKYAHEKEDGTKETWKELAERVSKNVLKSVGAKKSLIKEVESLIEKKIFIPGGRYLYATGRPYHQVNNCLLLRAECSREGWSELLHNASMALMTGAGIGVDYSQLRAQGKKIRKTGGQSSGPIALMCMVNEIGRYVMQGGSRRSAIFASLNWNHADINKFIYLKDWSDDIKNLKAKDYNFPATLDMTNISVQLDDLFFTAYNDEKHPLNSHAHSVYWSVVEHMFRTGEPGFSVDVGKNAKETLRNACVTGDTVVSILKEGKIEKTDIKSLVNLENIQDKKILIKSYNESLNIFEFKEVQRGYLTRKNTKILKILDKISGKEIKCTPDHLILTQRGYVRADELVSADELKIE